MPLFKNRSSYVKLYRPNGARYANGQTMKELSRALASAAAEFFYEFGEIPKQEETSFEVIGVTGGWAATILETKEFKNPRELRAGNPDYVRRPGDNEA